MRSYNFLEDIVEHYIGNPDNLVVLVFVTPQNLVSDLWNAKMVTNLRLSTPQLLFHSIHIIIIIFQQ